MSETVNSWLSQLATLPANDRAEIAYQLLHSLDGEADPGWEDAWADELDRRTAMIQNGQAVEEPAAEVVAALRKKYS